MSTNLFEILMQMLNFLILLWLMNKFLFRPLGSFLENRENTIKSDLEQSESARKEAEGLVQEQREILNQARHEAKQIRDDADKAAGREREALLAESKEDAKQLLNNAKKEIALNIERARQDLLKEIGALSVDLAGRVLKREMQSSDHQTVLDDYLEKMRP